MNNNSDFIDDFRYNRNSQRKNKVYEYFVDDTPDMPPQFTRSGIKILPKEYKSVNTISSSDLDYRGRHIHFEEGVRVNHKPKMRLEDCFTIFEMEDAIIIN